MSTPCFEVVCQHDGLACVRLSVTRDVQTGYVTHGFDDFPVKQYAFCNLTQTHLTLQCLRKTVVVHPENASLKSQETPPGGTISMSGRPTEAWTARLEKAVRLCREPAIEETTGTIVLLDMPPAEEVCDARAALVAYGKDLHTEYDRLARLVLIQRCHGVAYVPEDESKRLRREPLTIDLLGADAPTVFSHVSPPLPTTQEVGSYLSALFGSIKTSVGAAVPFFANLETGWTPASLTGGLKDRIFLFAHTKDVVDGSVSFGRTNIKFSTCGPLAEVFFLVRVPPGTEVAETSEPVQAWIVLMASALKNMTCPDASAVAPMVCSLASNQSLLCLYESKPELRAITALVIAEGKRKWSDAVALFSKTSDECPFPIPRLQPPQALAKAHSEFPR